LRDGLIQVLYMVQTELAGRPEEDSNVSEIKGDNDATERMMRINAPAMAPG
jgi:hypothetical protein